MPAVTYTANFHADAVRVHVSPGVSGPAGDVTVVHCFGGTTPDPVESDTHTALIGADGPTYVRRSLTAEQVAQCQRAIALTMRGESCSQVSL